LLTPTNTLAFETLSKPFSKQPFTRKQTQKCLSLLTTVPTPLSRSPACGLPRVAGASASPTPTTLPLASFSMLRRFSGARR